MAARYIQPGKTITFIAPTGGVTNGQGVVVNGLFLVAAFAAAVGEECEGHTEGVWDFDKATGTSDVFSAGDPVYFDEENDRVTGVPIGPKIGEAIGSVAAAATTMNVRLSQPDGEQVSGVAILDATGGLAIGDTAFGPTLPKGARITEARYRVLTTFTSATDAATIGLGFDTDDVDGIVASNDIADASNPWDAGWHETIQGGAVADYSVKLTAARRFEAVVAIEALTAGKLALHYTYVRE